MTARARITKDDLARARVEDALRQRGRQGVML